MIRVVLFLLVFPLSAFAGSGSGTTGFAFVKIQPGARQAAMGGALSAIGGDVNALYWNPAGLARLAQPQATIAYTNHFQDAQFGFLGYARPLDAVQAIGVGVQYLSYGTFQETTVADPAGSQLGVFGANDLAVLLSYSRAAGRYVAFGVVLKALYERIQDFSTDAYAADAGIQVRIPSRRLGLGVVVQHAGATRSGFAGDARAPLPVSLRAGLHFTPEHLPLLISADIEKPRAQDVAGHLGGEFNIRDLVFLRAGYATSGRDLRVESSDTPLMGAAAGLGVQMRGYRLDYAYTPALRLGDIHRVSLTFQF